MLYDCILSLMLQPVTDGRMDLLVVGKLVHRDGPTLTLDFSKHLQRLQASGFISAPGAYVLTADASQCFEVELQ